MLFTNNKNCNRPNFCFLHKTRNFIYEFEMSIYDDIAKKAWEAVLSKVKELAKTTRPADISRMLGHSGRSAVSNWINGKTTAQNATFAEMLRYLDVLEIRDQSFLPWLNQGEDCAQLRVQLEKAQLEISTLKENLIKAEARAQAYQDLLEKKMTQDESISKRNSL